jgi:uncharacterized circularly permuted ATP-grasp superfamily protein/uncharacterized alpha-E superfamily protein
MIEGGGPSSFGSGDVDLFGPDPEADPLAYYSPPDPAADLYASAPPPIQSAWRAVASGLSRQYSGDFAALRNHLSRHVEDLGLGYRIAGEEHERAWPLGPMPILIGSAEWAQVSTGLVQRAELLERVIADLYGDQSLVKDGALPAAVVSGSDHFARRLVGMPPEGGHYMHVYAVDLARGPSGEWRVLADRTIFPVGIGYAIENRQALARTTGGLLAGIGTRNHGDFFDALRQGMAACCERSEANMALLTPGRFNQFYPEQASLARHLGLALVEGRDLTVSEGRLYARTIAGLKRIDALWRWIGTRDLDPMNFDSRSRIGVPDLLSAIAGGLVVTNFPGVGVAESRAMPAFLPRLARTLLGEDLMLPNAATWWCGGEAEREHVLANLDTLMVSPSFGTPVIGLPNGQGRAGGSLSTGERAEIERGIAQRPMDYVAQEIVNLTTTPVLSDKLFEARGFTLRAFLARDASGNWTALDGGFARVSQQGDLRSTLMGLGDVSSDVCIIDTSQPERPQEVLETAKRDIRRDQGLLPSQAADNLYWMGRYGERVHMAARIVRVLVDQIASRGEESARTQGTPGDRAPSTTDRLARLRRKLGAAQRSTERISCLDLGAKALNDTELNGSVRSVMSREQQIALLLRDRLPRDAWRAVQRSMPGFAHGDIDALASACDRLIERHATFAWLMTNGMAHPAARRFFDMGLRIERASIILQAAQAMIPGRASAKDLSALLDIVDGGPAYRARYLSMPYIARVYDLLLLDPAQPMGLAYQLDALRDHLAAIPPLRDDGMPEEPVTAVKLLRAGLEGTAATEIGTLTIEEWRSDLAALHSAIGARFFLQAGAPEERTARLLG